ncbi:hypothetical protein RhiLY_10375 [Ceratobasidium sp. AG-Ba]|nr:hypothetical protein RhiLY_10375 [Ceratobasidium sp. AG-Ba]
MPPRRQVAPRPPQPQRVCPHCNLLRSERQISRHLHPYREGAEYMSQSESDAVSENSSSDDDARGEPEIPPVPEELEAPGEGLGNIDLAPPALMHLDHIDHENPHAVPPLLEDANIADQLRRILLNPHAVLDQWGNYVEPDASEADDHSVDEGSASSNGDPLFEERMDKPEPNPNDPNDEPYIDFPLLRNLLIEHLADVTTLVSKGVYFLFWIRRRRRRILA